MHTTLATAVMKEQESTLWWLSTDKYYNQISQPQIKSVPGAKYILQLFLKHAIRGKTTHDCHQLPPVSSNC